MNGGRDNAYTDNADTNFFFEVDAAENVFEHALDIFSRFFIDPLLSRESMDDEIWAVDNEYRKDLPSQQWRDWRMLEYSSNPQHPFHRFTVGSIETLRVHDQNVYDRMLQFHRKWVKAEVMKLVIYGKEDTQTLAKWAKHKFSAIPSNRTLKRPTYSAITPYRVGIETGTMYYIETISKQKQLRFFWGISGKELHGNYRSPVLSFINDHLLSSAANNSLFDVLKTKLLMIESMQCAVFYDEKEWSGTSISFELTERGQRHIDLISFHLFKYLNLLLVTAQNNKELRDVYALYFAESKCMDTLYFNYYSLIKKDAYSIVSGLAKRMQYRSKQDLLYLSMDVPPDRLIFDLSKTIEILALMADPNNVIVHYTNDQFDSDNFEETEPFFNIKFHKKPIPTELIQKWSDIDPFDDDEGGQHPLSIPPLNPYILDKDNKCNLDSVELIKESKENKKKKKNKEEEEKQDKEENVPELIMNEPSINIWYLGDHSFKSPRININVLLISPMIYDTAMNAIFAEIWLQFINFYSSEWDAEIAAASYSFELSLNHQGMVLSVTGLNEQHLSRLLEEFISSFLTKTEQLIHRNLKLSVSVLGNILESLSKTYKNLNYNHVWTQGYFAMYDITKRPHFDRRLMLDLVNGLLSQRRSSYHGVLQEMVEYVEDVLSSGFLIEALFHGNIYKKNAMELVESIRLSGINVKQPKYAEFGEHLLTMSHLKLEMEIKGAEHRKFVFQGRNSNEKDTNDVVQVWFQFGSNSFSEENYKETVKVLLLSRMMKSECFQVLRTEESLGYVATVFSKSSVGATNNINYLAVMVASGHKSADYLDRRVMHFVNEHYHKKVLLAMTEEKFKKYVNGTVSDLEQKYLRLSQQTSLIWDEIIGHTYFFQWKLKYIHILNALSLDDMLSFYKSKILGAQAKRISIQLFHQKQEKKEQDGKTRIHRKHKKRGHRIIAKQSDEDGILYFNKTKDLQNIGYAKYFDVY